MKVNTDKEQLISINRVNKILQYCPKSGELTSLIQRGPISIGQRLGCLDTHSNYRYIMIDGVRVLEHRLIWFIMNLSWPIVIIDHIDKIRSNNIYSNLRDSSYRGNSTNKINNSPSGHNITLTKANNYMVTITINSVRHSYGTYKTNEQAIKVRNIVIHSISMNLNIPNKASLKRNDRIICVYV